MALASYAQDLELIADAARQAADIAMPYFRKCDLDVQWKAGNSPVSEADFKVDHFLRHTLLAARPSYGWLSEETADLDPDVRMKAQRTFIVDPIDGTRAFIDGNDMWCISIAIVEEGRPVCAALIVPARNAFFVAAKGQNPQLNGADISLNHTSDMPIIGGPKRFLDAAHKAWDFQFQRQHHIPSLAYRIALVATGQLDATFVRANAHEWDLAAADLIATQMGITLCDEDGAPIIYNQRCPQQGVLIVAREQFVSPMRQVVDALALS